MLRASRVCQEHAQIRREMVRGGERLICESAEKSAPVSGLSSDGDGHGDGDES